MDEVVDCPHCGTESYRDEMAVQGGRCPVCGKYNEELDMARKLGSRRTAGDLLNAHGSDVWPGKGFCRHCGEDIKEISPDSGEWSHDYDADHDAELDEGDAPLGPGYDRPGFGTNDIAAYEDHLRHHDYHTGSLRVAAAAFVDAQNTADPTELAYRAARHVDTVTWSWPRTASAAARDLFVAAVLASCDCGQDQACEDCGAEAGESCRPWCTGQAAHEDEKAEKKKKKSHRVASDDDTARRVKECESGSCGHPEPTEDGDDAWAEAHDNPHVPRKKSHRTAFLPDFDDQLLFGN